MQCLPVDVLPEGPERAYEFKLDGYRALGLKIPGSSQLISRNAKDLSARFPDITAALKRLPDETVVDGEVVAINAAGRPSFSDLENYQTSSASLFYYLFDLLIYRGKDLRQRRLKEQRATLEKKIVSRLSEPIRLAEVLVANPRELTELVRSNGLEGLIAKRMDSVYESGKRSGRWVKLRVNRSQEFVIGGYVPLSGSFDSIAIGYYDGDDLICVARVRNGFVPESRAKVFKLFRALEIDKCPFANLPVQRKGRWGEGFTADDTAKCRWLRPRLVVQVEFAEWTPANHLRHAKFIVLRDDKEPGEVRRDRV